MPLFLHLFLFYTIDLYKHQSFITFHRFSRRDSNLRLPYSKPAYYHLNHAAPLPEPHCPLSEQRYTIAEPRCTLTKPYCIIDMLTKSGKNCGSFFYTGDPYEICLTQCYSQLGATKNPLPPPQLQIVSRSNHWHPVYSQTHTCHGNNTLLYFLNTENH